MGFFSDFLNCKTDSEVIAEKILNFCINSELSDFERNFIINNNINKDEFIRIKSLYNIKMFAGLFASLESQLPNTQFTLTQMRFQQLYLAHWPHEDFSWIAWEDAVQYFSEDIMGTSFTSLDTVLQNNFKELTNEYHWTVINFLRKHKEKLSQRV